MRFTVFIGVATLALMAGTDPVLAQNNQQANPYYAAPTGGNYYTNNSGGMVPYYNNSAQPVPQAMVAGKNAPSYSYNRGAQPYNNFNSMGNTNGAPMSPQDAASMRAQRDQQAQLYQQQYYQQAQNMGQAGMGGAYNTLQNAVAPQQQQPAVKTTKRLVYRESDNPLSTPPRLFNPDQ